VKNNAVVIVPLLSEFVYQHELLHSNEEKEKHE
jgi:hypothetical protein